jgi:hypothetical protein
MKTTAGDELNWGKKFSNGSALYFIPDHDPDAF